MIRNFHLFTLFSLCLWHSANADKLTIYSQIDSGGAVANYSQMNLNPKQARNVPGFALVHQEKEIELKVPVSEIQSSQIPNLIDPTTVSIRSKTAPRSTHVIEQNFKYDLLNHTALLTRFIDQEVSSEGITGKLIGFDDNKVFLETAGGRIHHLAHPSIYPELPEGLYTKPTLIWQIATDTEGLHQLELNYHTGGMTWWTDYNILYHADQQTMTLNAWVNLVNQSGIDFTNANIQLVAGDVQKIQQAMPKMARMGMELSTMSSMEDASSQFSQEQLFEYYLYKLNRTADLPNQSSKQIEFFPAISQIPVEKVMIYNGAGTFQVGPIYSPKIHNYQTQQSKDVAVYLTFNNDKKHKLGFALPGGRIRVNQQQANEHFEFIGEDTISHTAKNENLQIRLGNAFDVKGGRKQLQFNSNEKQKWLEETFEITIENHKTEAVKVLVQEPLDRWKNWKVLKSSMPYEKLGTQMIQFSVNIPAEQSKTVSYSVRYEW